TRLQGDWSSDVCSSDLIPELFRFEQENAGTRRMYGLEQEETKTFGQVCLTARRLVERGVRFVQVFHGGSGNDNNGWDAHSDLKEIGRASCRERGSVQGC